MKHRFTKHDATIADIVNAYNSGYSSTVVFGIVEVLPGYYVARMSENCTTILISCSRRSRNDAKRNFVRKAVRITKELQGKSERWDLVRSILPFGYLKVAE
jgi:hypothetical protein